MPSCSNRLGSDHLLSNHTNGVKAGARKGLLWLGVSKCVCPYLRDCCWTLLSVRNGRTEHRSFFEKNTRPRIWKREGFTCCAHNPGRMFVRGPAKTPLFSNDTCQHRGFEVGLVLWRWPGCLVGPIDVSLPRNPFQPDSHRGPVGLGHPTAGSIVIAPLTPSSL